ncbi:MAG: hypothetical protein R2724_03115 [Bryobacterales bacterium]
MSWASKVTRRQVLGVLAAASSAQAQVRPAFTASNDHASVTVDLLGGSIVDFRLAGGDLNPLVWSNDAKPAEAKPMSHFLCLDRWGQPSPAELANGMPFHGEATRVRWTDQGRGVLSARLPLAGLRIERTVRMLDGAAFRVDETVTNENKLGRVYNMVQHPTIGPPFLDEHVLVDSNARQGFMQSSPLPNPEVPAIAWPMAWKDAQPVDLRRLTDDPLPNVCSFVIDGETGWVTAYSPTHRLIVGYVWKTADYPWLNIWRHVADGKPLARGLEFGTTGLHQPFPALVRKKEIFGRPLLDYLDAGESKTRSYVAFLAQAPADLSGVGAVETDGGLTLTERGGERKIAVLPTGLF